MNKGVQAALVLSFGIAAASPAAADVRRPTPAVETDYTMVSMPDFLNADIADVSDSPLWQPGDPNGISPSYTASLDTVLDDVDQWDVTDVLIAGDLVEGRWGRDDSSTGIFGPVETEAQKVAALGRAARQYYPEAKGRFTSRGMRIHAAVGDHEIGDNNWSAFGSPYERFKHRHVNDFKAQWAKYFTNRGTRYVRHPSGTNHDATAYSVKLAPEILLVTVDVFRRTPTEVVASIKGGQMTWLESVLANAKAKGIDWVIVQGHTPVAGPVRYQNSSRLMYENGTDSKFWRVMKEYGVDLYLAGEVHDTTALVPSGGGPIQISHGGLFHLGRFSYMVCDFSGETLRLQTRAFNASVDTADGYLWQTDRDQMLPSSVTYQPGSFVTGTMTVDKDGDVLGRSGALDLYDPSPTALRLRAQVNANSMKF